MAHRSFGAQAYPVGHCRYGEQDSPDRPGCLGKERALYAWNSLKGFETDLTKTRSQNLLIDGAKVSRQNHDTLPNGSGIIARKADRNLVRPTLLSQPPKSRKKAGHMTASDGDANRRKNISLCCGIATCHSWPCINPVKWTPSRHAPVRNSDIRTGPPQLAFNTTPIDCS